MRILSLCLISAFAISMAGCKVSQVTPDEEFTVSLAVTNTIVGTTNGANTITATFTGVVQALSTTNANHEFTITGCTVSPSVAISTSTVSGVSVATATLSGGTCANGSTVEVELHMDQVLNKWGVLGKDEDNQSIDYSIDTSIAVATLNSAQYPSSQGAIKSGDTATLSLSYANAHTQSLTAQSGTTTSAPTGLTVSTTGTASCTTVQISSPSTSGATISVSGCTGDGSVQVQVNAGVATSISGSTNAASTQRTIVVENTSPTVVLSGTSPTGGSDGSNVITATFSSLVTDLSAANSSGQVVVAGCTTTQPTVAISMSTNGSGQSVATLTLSGGVCTSGDNVTVEFHLENVTDLAGNVGQSSDNPSPETYTIP